MTAHVNMDMCECSCKDMQPIAMSAMNNCVAISKNQVISVHKHTEATSLKLVAMNSFTGFTLYH